MPALPKVLLSVIILVFTLFTLTLTRPAFAQAGWSISLSVDCSDPSANLFTTATIPGPVGEDGYIKIYKDGSLYKTAQDFSPGTPNFPQGLNPQGTYNATIHDTTNGPVLATSNTVEIDDTCGKAPPPPPPPPPPPQPSPSPLPPNIKPCENPYVTDKLTDNVLDPYEEEIIVEGEKGKKIPISRTIQFTVDFSALQAIFGAPNSNYLEARFQDESHRSADLLNLNGPDLNQYHGPGQKAAPKYIVDQLKKNYVNYVYERPYLIDAAHKFADINGNNPKTIEELVNEFGPPDPPEAGEDRTAWLATWGRYWEKIPTAVYEFTKGELVFRAVLLSIPLQKKLDEGKFCPGNVDKFDIVLPEFFRTTSLGNQLNLIMVPKAAQTYDENLLPTTKLSSASNTQLANNPQSTLSKIVQACLKAISKTPFDEAFKHVVKISLDLLNPISNAYAQTQPLPCINILRSDKQGAAKYCALPKYEAERENVNCQNKNDPNKLDQDNPNVICTFTITWNGSTLIEPDDEDIGESCQDKGDGTYKCTFTLKIWPVFRIPWLAEIWNQTTYSDEADQKVAIATQITGKPGVYTYFKPKSVDSIAVFPKGKNLPGKQDDDSILTKLRQRFFGAVDCNKEFDRDWALKPKALQNFLRISNTCEVE